VGEPASVGATGQRAAATRQRVARLQANARPTANQQGNQQKTEDAMP